MSDCNVVVLILLFDHIKSSHFLQHRIWMDFVIWISQEFRFKINVIKVNQTLGILSENFGSALYVYFLITSMSKDLRSVNPFLIVIVHLPILSGL
jgi:hypothetical protein